MTVSRHDAVTPSSSLSRVKESPVSDVHDKDFVDITSCRGHGQLSGHSSVCNRRSSRHQHHLLTMSTTFIVVVLLVSRTVCEPKKLRDQLEEFSKKSQGTTGSDGEDDDFRRSFTTSLGSTSTSPQPLYIRREKELRLQDDEDDDDKSSASSASSTKEDPLESILPRVKFNCKGRIEGYYADSDFDCEVFHYCKTSGFRFTFVCPPSSKFNQRQMTCDYEARDNICSNMTTTIRPLRSDANIILDPVKTSESDPDYQFSASSLTDRYISSTRSMQTTKTTPMPTPVSPTTTSSPQPVYIKEPTNFINSASAYLNSFISSSSGTTTTTTTPSTTTAESTTTTTTTLPPTTTNPFRTTEFKNSIHYLYHPSSSSSSSLSSSSSDEDDIETESGFRPLKDPYKYFRQKMHQYPSQASSPTTGGLESFFPVPSSMTNHHHLPPPSLPHHPTSFDHPHHHQPMMAINLSTPTHDTFMYETVTITNPFTSDGSIVDTSPSNPTLITSFRPINVQQVHHIPPQMPIPLHSRPMMIMRPPSPPLYAPPESQQTTIALQLSQLPGNIQSQIASQLGLSMPEQEEEDNEKHMYGLPKVTGNIGNKEFLEMSRPHMFHTLTNPQLLPSKSLMPSGMVGYLQTGQQTRQKQPPPNMSLASSGSSTNSLYNDLNNLLKASLFSRPRLPVPKGTFNMGKLPSSSDNFMSTKGHFPPSVPVHLTKMVQNSFSNWFGSKGQSSNSMRTPLPVNNFPHHHDVSFNLMTSASGISSNQQGSGSSSVIFSDPPNDGGVTSFPSMIRRRRKFLSNLSKLFQSPPSPSPKQTESMTTSDQENFRFPPNTMATSESVHHRVYFPRPARPTVSNSTIPSIIFGKPNIQGPTVSPPPPTMSMDRMMGDREPNVTLTRRKRQLFGRMPSASLNSIHLANSASTNPFLTGDFGVDLLLGSSGLFDGNKYLSSPSNGLRSLSPLFGSSWPISGNGRIPSGSSNSIEGHFPNPFPTVPLETFDFEAFKAATEGEDIMGHHHQAPPAATSTKPFFGPSHMSFSDFAKMAGAGHRLTFKPIIGSTTHKPFTSFSPVINTEVHLGHTSTMPPFTPMVPPSKAKMVAYEYMYKPISMIKAVTKRPPKRDKVPEAPTKVSYEKVNLPALVDTVEPTKPTYKQDHFQPSRPKQIPTIFDEPVYSPPVTSPRPPTNHHHHNHLQDKHPAGQQVIREYLPFPPPPVKASDVFKSTSNKQKFSYVQMAPAVNYDRPPERSHPTSTTTASPFQDEPMDYNLMSHQPNHHLEENILEYHQLQNHQPQEATLFGPQMDPPPNVQYESDPWKYQTDIDINNNNNNNQDPMLRPVFVPTIKKFTTPAYKKHRPLFPESPGHFFPTPPPTKRPPPVIVTSRPIPLPSTTKKPQNTRRPVLIDLEDDYEDNYPSTPAPTPPPSPTVSYGQKLKIPFGRNKLTPPQIVKSVEDPRVANRPPYTRPYDLTSTPIPKIVTSTTSTTTTQSPQNPWMDINTGHFIPNNNNHHPYEDGGHQHQPEVHHFNNIHDQIEYIDEGRPEPDDDTFPVNELVRPTGHQRPSHPPVNQSPPAPSQKPSFIPTHNQHHQVEESFGHHHLDNHHYDVMVTTARPSLATSTRPTNSIRVQTNHHNYNHQELAYKPTVTDDMIDDNYFGQPNHPPPSGHFEGDSEFGHHIPEDFVSEKTRIVEPEVLKVPEVLSKPKIIHINKFVSRYNKPTMSTSSSTTSTTTTPMTPTKAEGQPDTYGSRLKGKTQISVKTSVSSSVSYPYTKRPQVTSTSTTTSKPTTERSTRRQVTSTRRPNYGPTSTWAPIPSSTTVSPGSSTTYVYRINALSRFKARTSTRGTTSTTSTTTTTQKPTTPPLFVGKLGNLEDLGLFDVDDSVDGGFDNQDAIDITGNQPDAQPFRRVFSGSANMHQSRYLRGRTQRIGQSQFGMKKSS